MNTTLMFSSVTDKWDTPKDLVDDLATVFDWDLDVCASRPNVCDMYYSEGNDGLQASWFDDCWMNPPYGREIGKWVDRARLLGSGFTSSDRRIQNIFRPVNFVVCLVPARTDTQWWQRNIKFASHVVFIKGRLKFGGAKNSAPFPSAFVVFGEINEAQKDKLFSYGWGVSQ